MHISITYSVSDVRMQTFAITKTKHALNMKVLHKEGRYNLHIATYSLTHSHTQFHT